MMSKEGHNSRLAERLRRTRRSAVEIVIESGAGSLLPFNKHRDVEATRRGLASIRRTAAEHRAAAKYVEKNKDE
jgi:hypothetical protein